MAFFLRVDFFRFFGYTPCFLYIFNGEKPLPDKLEILPSELLPHYIKPGNFIPVPYIMVLSARELLNLLQSFHIQFNQKSL